MDCTKMDAAGLSSLPGREGAHEALTSLKLFRKFIHRTLDPRSGEEVLNAERVVSRECYELWLRTRARPPRNPETAFQKALSCHLGAMDGRRPFKPNEEAAILRVLRRKQRWPCFADSKIKKGSLGYRGKGFHEKRRLENNNLDLYDHEDESANEWTEDERNTMLCNKRARTMGDVDDARTTTSCSGATSVEVELEAGESIPDPYLRQIYMGCINSLHYLHDMGINTWNNILRALKYVTIARGTHTPAELGSVKELFKRYCEEYPEDYIFAADPLPKSLEERIILQSENTVAIVGRVAREGGGEVHGTLFVPGYEWAILRCLLRAWSKPEEENWVNVVTKDLEGTLLPFRLHLYIHSDVRVVIIRAIKM